MTEKEMTSKLWKIAALIVQWMSWNQESSRDLVRSVDVTSLWKQTFNKNAHLVTLEEEKHQQNLKGTIILDVPIQSTFRKQPKAILSIQTSTFLFKFDL